MHVILLLLTTLILGTLLPSMALPIALPTATTPDEDLSDDPDVDGGVWPIDVTPELSSMLYTTLGNITTYDSRVKPRVCVTKIVSATKQMTAGWSYTFIIQGCEVHASLLQQTHHEPSNRAIAHHVGKCSKQLKRHCVPLKGIIGMQDPPIYPDVIHSLHITSITTSLLTTSRPRVRVRHD